MTEEEFTSIIENSEIIERLFKYEDLEYEDKNDFFITFQKMASSGLRNKFFDTNNKLRDFIGDLLEKFPTTRYYTIEILYNLYKGDNVLKKSLKKGIAEIFKKGSFSLVHDLLDFAKIQDLDDILLDAWDSQFFTRETPVIKQILENLKGIGKYKNGNSIRILSIIWRYMEYNLPEEIINYILEDEEKRVDLLLRMVTVWHEGTIVLNPEAISELMELGDQAIEKLKEVLKGKIINKGYYISGKLDKLSFRFDLQEYWQDFNNTILIIYELFGGKELIRYLDHFDDIRDLIYLDKSNFPGPFDSLADALLECSESKNSFLITMARNIFKQFDNYEQKLIIEIISFDYIYLKEIIRRCIEKNELKSLRFFLNFDIFSELSEDVLISLLEDPSFNLLEKLIRSFKEIDHFPSEEFDEFIEKVREVAPESLKNCIYKLSSSEKNEFLNYFHTL